MRKYGSKNCEEYLIRRSTYINEFFWKLRFLKYFYYLLKMCPIFVGSVHSLTMTLFSEKVLISNRCIIVFWCPTWSKNLERSLITVLLLNKQTNEIWMFKVQFRYSEKFTKIRKSLPIWFDITKFLKWVICGLLTISHWNSLP